MNAFEYKTVSQENGPDISFNNIELSYNDILQLIENYKDYGFLYHGTANSEIKRELLPPNVTQVISEKGRQKNLNRVFFTKDPKSAEIYAKRAVNSYGGIARVLKVLPLSDNVTLLNSNDGTTVLHASQAIVITEQLEKIILDKVFDRVA